MTDNGTPSNDDKSIQSSNELALSSLTDKNWLFIKHFLETSDVEKAYLLAGYEGSAPSTKYDLFKKLKPFIEEIASLGVVSRVRLMADLTKVLALPLVDRGALTVSEWLRVRKFASSLIPELKQDSKVSLLVVNRYAEGKGNTDKEGKGNNVTPSIDPNNIIDAEPLQ